MGKWQRDKGAGYERETACDVREMLLGLVSADAIRRSGESQARSGSTAPDVLVGDVPIWVECKRGACPNIVRAMAQGEAASRLPVVVHTRRDREQTIVSMRKPLYGRMLRAWVEAGCP